MSYTDITGAGHRLHLSYQQVLRLVLRGELEAERIAGRWRIDTESLEQFARARTDAASQGAEVPAK